MKQKKEKITFYLSDFTKEFLKHCKNKTEVINNAIEEFAINQKKKDFLSKLQNFKPHKSKVKVVTALQKARTQD